MKKNASGYTVKLANHKEGPRTDQIQATVKKLADKNQSLIDSVTSSRPTSLQDIVRRLETFYVEDPLELLAISRTITDEFFLDQEPDLGANIFVGLELRRGTADGSLEEYFDLYVGNSMFSFDLTSCEILAPFKVAIRPLFGRGNIFVLSHDCQSITHLLLEKPHHLLDAQMIGEHLLGEPFLDQESLLSKLLTRRLGTEQSTIGLGPESKKHLFHHLLSAECLSNLSQEQLVMLNSATTIRSEMRPEEQNKAVIDPKNNYSIHSVALFQQRFPEDEISRLPTPLVEENDIDAIIGILPKRLSTRLETHSYAAQSKDKITEIVLDVSRQPPFWGGGKAHALCRGRSALSS